MSKRTIVEYYDGKKCVARMDTAMVPPVGAYINLRGVTWVVTNVTYAIDFLDRHYDEHIMRANVDLGAP